MRTSASPNADAAFYSFLDVSFWALWTALRGEAAVSDELRVEVDRLREASRFVSDKARIIRERVAKLDKTIGQELLADGWQGKAASAYDESWVEWKAGADKVADALEQSAAKLAQAAIQYEAQDVARRDAMDQIAGQVPADGR
ncbi:WXG100 family type VII secretion target [Nocardia sp. NPDC049149]|uniref:WXG100 family type VII secretion target n=1 Tax=Nocardia sp. NPDC049149 TaxID=3364315 RepID=UPI003714DB35